MSDWLTTDEAVEISGYNLQYVRELVRDKKIKAVKKGGSYWVDKQSLLDYIAAAKESQDKRRGAKAAR
jgi:excisionase family DNA binding protein